MSTFNTYVNKKKKYSLISHPQSKLQRELHKRYFDIIRECTIQFMHRRFSISRFALPPSYTSTSIADYSSPFSQKTKTKMFPLFCISVKNKIFVTPRNENLNTANNICEYHTRNASRGLPVLRVKKTYMRHSTSNRPG